MENFFAGIYNWFACHKKAYWTILVTTVAACALLASQIHFEEDISRMLSHDEGTKELNNLAQNSKSIDRIIFSISAKNNSDNKDSLILVADTLVARIGKQCGGLLDDIRAQMEQDDISRTYDIITRNYPSFVSEQHFDRTLDRAFRPQRLDSTINGYLRILGTPGGMFARQAFTNDPAGLTLPLFAQLKELQSSAQFTVVDNYLFSNDERNLIILLFPKYSSSETGHNRALVAALDDIVNEFNTSIQGKDFKAWYFGSVVVAVGNARQVQKDTYTTVAFVGIVLLVLLLSIFQKKRLPLLIMATVGFGLLFSLAMVSIIEDSISLIAIGTGAVILGVAVNYPIHFFTHYLHNKDVLQTIRSMVAPMTIGSLTTIGGFLCLTLTNSELLYDFGLFGAFCLTGAALFSLVFLPHLAGVPKESYKTNLIKRMLEKASQFQLDRRPFFIILILMLTPVLFYFSFDVEYEEDLNKLNYMSKELQETEKDFLQLSGNDRNLLVITKGKTVEDVLFHSYSLMLLVDSLQQAGNDCYFSGVTRAIPPKQVQAHRIGLWNKYWNESLKQDMKDAVAEIFLKRDIDISRFSHFFASLEGHEKIIPETDYEYLLKTFGSDFLSENDTLSTLISQIQVSPEFRPALARIAENTPNTMVLDKSAIASSLVASVSDNFNKITFITSLLVFFAILLSYGRIELTLITFVPMVISWVWILGFMGLFHIKFNIVNIILSTFIFGLGDDFCIFTTDGNLKAYTRKENHTSVIRMSVLISGLTSLVGLGSLIFAKHPAMHSLGAISVLGILSVLFVSQVMQPFLFRLLIERPTRKGNSPISLLTLVNSICTFTYFTLGCIILSVLSLIVKIIPIRAKQKKAFLHWLKYYLMNSLVYGVAFVIKKVRQNPHGETFEKPAIIIANHQSMLDILYILCLHPRIVMVVKSWVWNSPVMGVFVRMAGFHTIDHGTEDNTASYRKTLDEGYSIAVFPEGSRSDGHTTQRFHKGAFFLAEQLQADIVPLVIQHNFETLPRDSFMVYPNQMTMRVYERIPATDHSFGSTYQERTKEFSRWYKSEYVKVGEENANARYCLRKLKDAYMYHSPTLEWYLRVKVKLEKSYEFFESIVPRQGHIVDVGCGYGFLSYVLAIRSSGRTIMGIDYDEEKISVAENTYIRNDRINFVHADIIGFDFPQADCFILSDVLHYIPFGQACAVMSEVAGQLSDGGRIIVRDADTKEHHFNKVSEFFSTKVFRFNKTNNRLTFFSAGELIGYMKTLGFKSQTIGESQKMINTFIIFERQR